MIPYGRQDIQQADIDAVVVVLESDFLTQGPCVPAFEQALAHRVGAAHGVATNSATSALHLACLALGLGPGKRLWTSPITFVASANCALYCGAAVEFVDIDPATYNLCPDALERKLAQARSQGALPDVVMPVHLCGRPCDMVRIHALADTYGFKVIEDASHAVGARIADEHVGSCRYSDITVFSFHPVKIITTAEGGMALTNDEALAARMALLRSHGITRDAEQMTEASHGPWYYQQLELGYNYRMTDLQAALGLSQLARLDGYIARRNQLADRYDTLLAELPLDRPARDPDSLSACHLYVIQLRLAEMQRSHREVFTGLREFGIGVNLHYIPVNAQPYYRHLGHRPEDCPNAMDYYARSISIPLYPAMTDEDQLAVVDALAQVIGAQ